MRKWTARVMAVLALAAGIATTAAAPVGATPQQPANHTVSHVNQAHDWWW